VNHNIVQSQIEGGVFLDGLQPATVLQIRTQHHRYTAILLGGSQALISGHPTYCPHPVLVAILGSTWGGSMLKLHFVGPRHASGVSSPGIPDTDRHIRDPRNY